MEKFAFILHPLDVKDMTRKFKVARYLPDFMVEAVLKRVPPLFVSHISGIRSKTGKEAEGWFVGCPLTARQMLSLPEDLVLEKIIRSARKAQELGAQIVGLGAFTSVVGDGGITVSKSVQIAVTTGNSLTVATALEGINIAARAMEIDMTQATVAVLGATGSIGRACSLILGKRGPGRLVLAARNRDKLEALRSMLVMNAHGLEVTVETDIQKAVQDADVVVAVTSALESIVDASALRPGSIVCDVARPRNVSRAVAEARRDVLVFEGGVLEVPGEVEFGFDFGFPPGMTYACMAETMTLALEGRYEGFSLGRELDVKKVEEIRELSGKHGFRLAGLRSFERALTEAEIQSVRKNAAAGRGSGQTAVCVQRGVSKNP